MTLVVTPSVRSIAPVVAPGPSGAAVGLVMLVGFLWLLIPLLALVGGVFGPAVPEVSAPAALLAATAGATLCGLAYATLTRRGWGAMAATALVLAVLAHPLTLYMVTAAPAALMLVVVLAALTTAIHRLAEIGDVQAQIGLGLALCLAPFGAGMTMPLVLPVAMFAALADVDGRRDLRAFLSLLLVLLLPLCITIAALELLPRQMTPLGDLLAALLTWREVVVALPLVSVQAIPVGALVGVPLVAALALVLVGRPTPGAGITVAAGVLLPTHLELLRQTVAPNMPNWLPTAALLATTVAVGLTERGRPARRGGLLALLALSAALAWVLPGPGAQGAWAEAVSRPFTRLVMAVASGCPGASPAGCLAAFVGGR